MNNDMRNLKFENLISNINDLWMTSIFRGQVRIRGFLILIYDYNELNNFGRIILNTACINTERVAILSNSLAELDYNFSTKKNDMKIQEAKKFFDCFKESRFKDERYQLLFWALLVLTVDQTDADEKLSLICDFARILKITDEEMEDIVDVIRIIYHEADADIAFRTERIPEIFYRTIRIYEN